MVTAQPASAGPRPVCAPGAACAKCAILKGVDVEEALSKSRGVERQLKHENRTEAAELLAAFRRSIEQHRAAESRGYKVGKAAEIIGVHRNTVRGWIRRGLLRAKQVESGDRRDYLIPPSEVRRAARAHKVSMDADPLTDQQVEEYQAALRQARSGTSAAPGQRQGRRRVDA
jgi:excisionase family DNA binding protein